MNKNTKSDLEKHDAASLLQLEQEESVFEERVKDADATYAGLKHIDDFLHLIVVKLRITHLLLDRIQEEPNVKKGEEMKKRAQTKAREGLGMLEEISTLTVSTDQRSVITDAPGFQQAESLFHKLLLKGGAGFFEEKTEGKKSARTIARAVTGALEKFADRDDHYQQVFKTEALGPFWKRLVQTFFFVLAPEHQQDPPYGIEEGEEEVYSSDYIKLPLSQAIVYYEEEVLPMLEEMLRESPGDEELQQRIESVKATVEQYREVSLSPRSKPLVLPKGYYTEGFTGYSQNGEPLVRVALPVTFSSKTNTDRMQELVKYQIVRELAGKGLCKELDKQYNYVKSLASGTAGNSMFPSLRLKTRKGFSALKNNYPLLKQIDNKREFVELLRAVTRHGRKTVEKRFESALLKGDSVSLKRLE